MVATSTCYRCGGIAGTRDHVVPSGLFPRSSVARRIKVPSCFECNNGLAEDEEYFRTVLIAMQWKPSSAVEEVFNKRVVPSFREDNTRLRRGLLESMYDISLYTDQGIVETGLVKLDAARMDRVAEKIVRGLYFHLRRERMGDDVALRFHWMPKQALIEEAMKGGVINVDRDVFTCRYRMTSTAPHASIWWMLFYKAILYVVTVRDSAGAAAEKAP